MHPLEKKKVIYNEFLDYAADMDLLLCYHNLMDDWIDDHNYKKFLLARSFKKRYYKVASMYPRQSSAIKKYIKHLHRCEQQNNQDLDCAAGLTGELLAEIFVYRDDIWKQNLHQMGFFLGKFIYLMDAYEDVMNDKEKNNYNPFLSMAEQSDFDQNCQIILNLMMADCCQAFERLPIIEYEDILRNILYSGVWIKFIQVRKAKEEKAGEKNNDI